MKKIQSVSLIFLFILVHASVAQIGRANKYYDNYNYSKAIDLYKKVLRKKGDDAEALEKIANSYRLTKNYQQAEIYYSRLVKKEGINPINYFYYGTVLKNNKKIDEAKAQFKKYSISVPDDAKVISQFKSLEDIKIWISRTQQYEVKPVASINTVHAEFSPVFFKNEIAYASSKKKDMVNESKDAWDGQPFLNILANTVKKDKNGNAEISRSASSFPWPINTDYHDGPLCFNAGQNMAYVSRVNYTVEKDKNFVNRPQLFIFELKGNKWTKSEPFPYNNESYSVVHPSLSHDGQYLYFSSDMPGGQGGMDLYVCKKEGTSWGKPQNLGQDVNTSGNEVFPYIRKDSTLFFSSDTHPGFGGLDVFSATLNGDKYSNVRNMGSPFNSSTDDFGVLFLEDNNGYLSSDRPGGKGSDDIYSFTALNKLIAVSGKILLSKDINDPAKNVQVNLLTADGSILKFTTTDSTGFFKFENLSPDENYMVKLNEDDPNLKKNNKYYLADQNGKIIRITVINDKGGKFVFTNLPADPSALPELGAEDINIAGNLLYGENPSKPMANTKVNLVNEKGEIVQTVTTNELGAFIFTNLPSDQNFFVKVDESDTKLAPNTKITITNMNGKEVQATVTDKNGGFKFEFLATDVHTLEMLKVEDSDLRFDFTAYLVTEKRDPLSNVIINLVNENGDILQSIKTDSRGSFLFTNLPTDKNILFALDENDTRLKEFEKLFLVDSKGNILKEISKSKGVFRFTILPSEEKKFGNVYAEDPELALKRKGLEVSGDSVRFEWKAYLVDETKKPLAKTGINLVNENNEVIQSIKTDDKGSFMFTNLPSDKKLLFAVDENDPNVKDLKILYIVDEKGNILKEIVKSGGKFIFSVLPSEEKALGKMYIEDPWLAVTKLKRDNLSGVITNIENIYYDYGKADLLPEAKKILDKVIYIMKEDPQLHLVLESHTDSRSSYGFNIKLSRLRANTAVDYMIASGIPKERIRGKGFGEMKPINKCKDGVPCTEADYAKNRRTEFKIVRKKK
jgi:outer membrane protein OmpA-like peptidoglycan-associated protein